MATVDLRTRSPHASEPFDLDAFLDEFPDRAAGSGAAAGAAATRLGLLPLTFDVEGRPVTLTPEDDGVAVTRAAGGRVVVELDRAAFGDLVRDAASTFGLTMTARARVTDGPLDAFVAWEPVLRCLLDGRPVYQPGSVAFTDRDGGPLDVQRSFTLDDDPADIGHFLAEAGFLHLQDVFTDGEMAAVSADHDAAMAAATRDDGASWWAQTRDGEWYPARILDLNRKSATLRELLRSERFTRLATFTDDRYVQRDHDADDTAEGLLKKVGVVEGISDVSWHKDCSMGGHSHHCCSLIVGISVTGAGPKTGELGAVAGSHRANVVPLGLQPADLPRRALPTRTGDVTIHCSCTLHMSRPPVSAERRVVYTGFSLAPRDGDPTREERDPQSRRRRAELGDHVLRRQREGTVAAGETGFDL